MKKTQTRSRLEVWTAKYINNLEERNEDDEKATIIQIEPGNTPGAYIVEAMDPDPAPAEQHPDDRKCWTCKHGHRQIGGGPCEQCHKFNLWEPACAYCETCKYSENDRQKSPCAYCRYNHDSRWEAKEGGNE